ncbi:hypothetical protein NPIL_303391 [Nephila pilipes]|uniref:Uncharacterized protein n=1 Tax=Nephila pilipes TaxID=299642 RepID=A0A8X6QCY1_NEPPI|nr:hypothetical protein NPIL_303391 [Nephila pilipes]
MISHSPASRETSKVQHLFISVGVIAYIKPYNPISEIKARIKAYNTRYFSKFLSNLERNGNCELRGSGYLATSSKTWYDMCLPLLLVGRFQAIGECPMSWTESTRFCTDSIGHLPPVTSLVTGTTYASIFCAICH